MPEINKLTRYRPMSEINVVPYIDVMLVLLIIFMVTAPLLTQGVQVDLPQAKAEVLPQNENPPIVVTVDAKGDFFLDSKDPIAPKPLAIRVQALLKIDPTRTVLVKGDTQAAYGAVLQAMVLLKQNGVNKVGLMTQHFEEGNQ